MLQKLAYFYIVSPLIVWGFAWFNISAAVVFFLSLFISYYFVDFKQSTLSNNPYGPGKKIIFTVIAVATFWCFWSGIGGYVFQSGDFCARNAIYRDLIKMHWPVYYEYGHSTLNYYFGFWLIPAAVTKFIGLIYHFDDLFAVGLNILLLYSIVGVSVFLLLWISYFQPKNKKQLLLILMFPIFFSGLDVIGIFIFQSSVLEFLDEYRIIEIYLDTGPDGELQYNNMTTQLFWVFNQAVPSWIIMLLLLKEKDPKNYGILITSALFLCPLPAVGLMIFMVALCCKFIISSKQVLLSKLKDIFSLSNICIIPVFIMVAWFLSLHQNNNPLGFKPVPIQTYLIFCILEFACYVAFVFHMYRKNMLFYVMLFSLCTLSLFSFAEGYDDFQMRTTLPALLILSMFVLKYLLSEKGYAFNKIIISCLLVIGLCTPLVEFGRGAVHVATTKEFRHINNDWETLHFKGIAWPYSNYKVAKPGDNYFYQMFVRPKPE